MEKTINYKFSERKLSQAQTRSVLMIRKHLMMLGRERKFKNQFFCRLKFHDYQIGMGQAYDTRYWPIVRNNFYKIPQKYDAPDLKVEIYNILKRTFRLVNSKAFKICWKWQ